jgi:hypothetical protein
MILTDHFITASMETLIGCFSWPSAMLLLIQAGMAEVCIADTCSLTQKVLTDVYKNLPLCHGCNSKIPGGRTMIHTKVHESLIE